MHKVDNKLNSRTLFNDYNHNIAVIYSSLEDQYAGELYLDSEDNPQIAILFTPFGYHFVAGNPDSKNVVENIDEIIFHQYLEKTKQKEAIVFSPNDQWDNVLDNVFLKHKGIKDGRKIFHLNRDLFEKNKLYPKLSEGIDIKLSYEQDNGAKKVYPVSRLFVEDKCVSFCSGFMIGKGYAEIDVYTEDAYRGKGFAKVVSMNLIDELLKNDLKPSWCTWPYRVESEKLALSLGFELAHTVQAHIWLEGECGKIS